MELVYPGTRRDVVEEAPPDHLLPETPRAPLLVSVVREDDTLPVEPEHADRQGVELGRREGGHAEIEHAVPRGAARGYAFFFHGARSRRIDRAGKRGAA